jgi:WD40 repeat protein
MIFRCHRHQQKVYAVNSVSFSPISNNTFATTGSDGCVNFWNLNIFRRLYSLPQQSAPVIGGDFNSDGTLFAYAMSDDFSRGEGQIYNNEIYVHRVLDSVTTPNLDYNDEVEIEKLIFNGNINGEATFLSSRNEENMIDFEYGTSQFDSFAGEGIAKRKNIFFEQLRKSRSIIDQVKMKEKHLSANDQVYDEMGKIFFSNTLTF